MGHSVIQVPFCLVFCIKPPDSSWALTSRMVASGGLFQWSVVGVIVGHHVHLSRGAREQRLQLIMGLLPLNPSRIGICKEYVFVRVGVVQVFGRSWRGSVQAPTLLQRILVCVVLGVGRLWNRVLVMLSVGVRVLWLVVRKTGLWRVFEASSGLDYLVSFEMVDYILVIFAIDLLLNIFIKIFLDLHASLQILFLVDSIRASASALLVLLEDLPFKVDDLSLKSRSS